MDPWIVQISNWPPETWQTTELCALIIAGIASFAAIGALVVSIKSYKRSSERFELAQQLSKETFRQQNRPYVWAIQNYTNRHTGQRLPHVIGFQVINRPARIIRQDIRFWRELKGNETVIFSITYEQQLIRFSTTETEWTLTCVEMGEALSGDVQPGEYKRHIRIEYTSLDRDGHYFFDSTSTLNLQDTLWIPDYEDMEQSSD